MKATSSPTSTGSAPSSSPSGRPAAFDYQPLGRVVFAPGAVARVGELAAELGVTRPLLVTDPGLLETGHPERAAAALRAAGLAVAVFSDIEVNPTTAHVARGVAAARAHAADGLVAVGGGSAMDVAKGVNFILTNGGTMADYKGHGRARLPMLPSVGVPTTAGTGSEAQSYALIADASSHLKMACGDRKAAFRVAVLDPELTLSQPRAVTAITGLDSVVHAVEAFVCTKRNPVSGMFALQAWTLLQANLPTVLAEPGNLAARGAMQLGAHLAGMAIENAMLGISHSCANPLTAHYGVTHGVAVGVLVPHVVRFNAATVEGLYARLAAEAELPGDGSAAVARRLEELLAVAGVEPRLRDHGVSPDILPLLAEEASEQWTAKFNPRPVTQDDLLAVYRAAY